MTDTVEIEHAGRVLEADGRLQISTIRSRSEVRSNADGTIYRTTRPVAPFIRGYVIFRHQITAAEVMAITSATVRCTRSDGDRITFRDAAVMSVDPGRDRYGFTIDIMGTPDP